MGDYHGPSIERLFKEGPQPNGLLVPDKVSRNPLAVLESAFNKTRSQGSRCVFLPFQKSAQRDDVRHNVVFFDPHRVKVFAKLLVTIR